MKLAWRDDPDAESVLTYVGIPWCVKSISVDDIDWHESANNCARLWNPLNEEKIEDYHASMMRGDVFPRTVVELGRSGFVILGGNQRLNAAKKITDLQKVEAYVVQPLITAQRETVIRSLNSRHGWGSSKEERLEHAIFLVRKHGVSVADAAKLLIVCETTINKHMRAEDTRALLARRGVESSAITISNLAAMANIADEKTLVSLGKTVAEFRPTEAQTINTVKAVVSAPSVTDKAKALKEFARSLAASTKAERRNGSSLKRPRREKFLAMMERMVEFLERGNDGTGFSSMDELQCSELADGDKVRSLVAKILIRLKTIAGVHHA